MRVAVPILSAVALLLAGAAARAAELTPGPSLDDAVRLYDQGKYADARRALAALDAQGQLDGPSLYRLFFATRATGDEASAQGLLERARQALEKANASPSSIEIPFYLSNAYANIGRESEGAKIAAAATARVASGEWAPPETAIGLFQLAKLYQDQGRPSDAVPLYQKALDRFDLSEGRYVNNARWALRYIGDVASARGDFAAADRAYTRMTDLPGVTDRDWNSLAVARARAGNWSGASDAWRAAVKANPEDADDPRYSARLADAAARLAPLPAGAPEGAVFKAMSRENLESFLKTEAGAARDVHKRAAEAMRPETDGAAPRALEPKLRASLQDELTSIRGLFVAAALEYALRQLPIRETAFHDGYAVQIFQESEWTIPADPAPDAPG